MKSIELVISGLALTLASACSAGEPTPLVLEVKIPLGEVSGRIDHFAVDLAGQRLFLAEFGNDSVGVIDVRTQKLVRTITGFNEPQGVGYVPSTDTLYVANAGDGSVRLFQGADLSPSGRIELGKDADNIRVDMQANRVFIGYGDGALAVIDPSSRAKIADIPLKGHPEGFRQDQANGRIFVNVPDAGHIAVVDIASGKQTAAWPLNDAQANFPMAFDDQAKQVIVAFRSLPRLLVYQAEDGAVVVKLGICGDSDDVFVDSKRRRLYVSCGEGYLDVLEARQGSYERIARIPTASGARTSFFSPELDRLYVAARATWTEPAAVWVFRPQP